MDMEFIRAQVLTFTYKRKDVCRLVLDSIVDKVESIKI